MAFVDYRLHRSIPGVAILIGGALLAILAAPWLRRVVGTRLRRTRVGRRPALRVAVLAAVALVAFLVRWRGDMSVGAAVVVIGVPALIAVGMVAVRRVLDRPMGPIARVRDRLLPRWLRQVAAVATPVLVTFGLVHGSLGDLRGLVGGGTSPSPALADETAAMMLGGVLSMLIVFVLMYEPTGRDGGQQS